MHDPELLQGTILDDAALSVDELACACSVSTEWVVRHVREGSFGEIRTSIAEWRFSSRDLGRARRIRALERDFDAVPELAALVADMLEELDALRARVRRAGL
jgi:chaperone modulatory protein CbpM